MTDKEIEKIVRKRLEFPKEVLESIRCTPEREMHYRFDMSAIDAKAKAHNMFVLSLISDLGIYEYTNYLHLDFYKGNCRLYWNYIENGQGFLSEHKDFHFCGAGTIDILVHVLKITVFSGRNQR